MKMKNKLTAEQKLEIVTRLEQDEPGNLNEMVATALELGSKYPANLHKKIATLIAQYN